MKARALCGALALAAFAATPASAGIYADDLAKCLVKSSSAQDQADLVTWIFAVMSLNPAVRPYANFTDAQRADFDRKGGALFTRLMTADCRTESIAALKYEGAAAFETSFQVLGQVATRGLMSDPNVIKGMEGLGAAMDKGKLQALFKEAGLPVDKPAAAPPSK